MNNDELNYKITGRIKSIELEPQKNQCPIAEFMGGFRICIYLQMKQNNKQESASHVGNKDKYIKQT